MFNHEEACSECGQKALLTEMGECHCGTYLCISCAPNHICKPKVRK